MTISDINSEIRSLCDTDSTGYTAADLLRRVNNALETIIGRILGADGTWQWDDTNYTDLPIATTTLVADQQDYSFNSTHLEIERVEVKNANSIWQLLEPIDKSEIKEAMPEFFKTSGMPVYYDKQGSSVFLYPAPATASVTLTSGLRIYFKRTADLFTSAQVTTGTKEPGIASPYHMLICYLAAIPYCLTYKKDRVALFEKKAGELMEDMIRFYSRRERDKRKQATMKPILHR